MAKEAAIANTESDEKVPVISLFCVANAMVANARLLRRVRVPFGFRIRRFCRSASSEPINAPASGARDAQSQKRTEICKGKLTVPLAEQLEMVCKTESDDKIDDENSRSEPSPEPKNHKQSANHFGHQHQKQARRRANMEGVGKMSSHTLEVHDLI
jgi:hypothetical protein